MRGQQTEGDGNRRLETGRLDEWIDVYKATGKDSNRANSYSRARAITIKKRIQLNGAAKVICIYTR